MKQICVFCGSSPGAKPEYVEAARLLGQTLAERKMVCVYGGSRVGLMGQVAKACLEASGEVIGVIPRQLVAMEVAYKELAQLVVVESMHERKARMAELADGFIALPGGLGTFEEFLEVLTWAQLGMHRKPCGILNTCSYYDKLLGFLDQAVEQQFVEKVHRDMIQVDESPAGLLDKFDAYRAPTADKAAWALQMTEEIEGGGPP